MKILHFARVFTIASTFLASFFGIGTSPLKASASNFQISDPELFLNEDGTLNLPQDFSGTLDLTGWDVELNPWAGPIFSPHNLNEGEWAALSSNGAGNGSIGNNTVFALAVIGSDLYVGGNFANVNNNGTSLTAADRIAKWDGGNWSALSSNGAGNGSIGNNTVFALAVIGSDLYVGGNFQNVNNSGTALTAADRIVKWNGSSWSALGSNGAGNGSLLNGQVNGLVELSNHLYVGGTFIDVNNGGTSLTAADRVAQLGVGSPAYSGLPADGATLNIDGITGTSPSEDISVSNTGDTGTRLDVSLTSISAGYTVSGLPIAYLETSDPAATITVECDIVPQAKTALWCWPPMIRTTPRCPMT